jgi:hypothetical protein
MSHTIYVSRIILRPLSALFGSQFMLPMETSVTFIGACTNEIIRRNNSGFFLIKGKSEVMLESYTSHTIHIIYFSQITHMLQIPYVLCHNSNFLHKIVRWDDH